MTTVSSHLENEAKFYKLYERTYGVPQVYYFGQVDDNYALVMDLLGPTLGDMFEFCHKKFSHKTMLMLSIQMLRCLQFIHTTGFIHRDIKPADFLVGIGKN